MRAVLVAACLSGVALGLTCTQSCTVPPATGAPFCTPALSFPSCHASESVSTLDDAARIQYDAVLELTKNASVSCQTSLRKFECLRRFPICEFGDDYTLLCASACDEVATTCGIGVDLLGCSVDGSEQAEGVSSGFHCFQIEFDGPNKALWVIGFLINLVFSFCAALGINLQKHSLHTHDPAVPPLKQKMWLMGFTLIVCGSILDFVAFGLAPQSFLAPLAALSLVWNMFLAPRFHGERITRQNMVATAIICVGVTATVIFSSHNTPTYILADLIALYQKPVMYGFMVCVVAGLVALALIARNIERSGDSGSLLHIVCYGGMAGTFGGLSVTLAKSTVELIKSTLAGTPSFTEAPAFIIVVAMAACLICQITTLNEGLRRFDALHVVPVYQASWIIMSILGGLIYFEEYAHLDALQQFMFVFGSSITVGGIAYLLKTRRLPGATMATPVSSPAGGAKAPGHGSGSTTFPSASARRAPGESGPSYTPVGRHLEMVPMFEDDEGGESGEDAEDRALVAAMGVRRLDFSQLGVGDQDVAVQDVVLQVAPAHSPTPSTGGDMHHGGEWRQRRASLGSTGIPVVAE